MKSVLVLIASFSVLQVAFGMPQQLQRTLSSLGQQQILQPQYERFTAAVINSEISALTGFIGLFQEVMTNFWSTLPRFVNLIANPAAAATPPVPGLDASSLPSSPSLANVGLTPGQIPSQVELLFPTNIVKRSDPVSCQTEKLS